MRRLGVYGENLPAKKGTTIQPADFYIAGILGFFERRYKSALSITDYNDLLEKFGADIDSGWYGHSVVTTLLSNKGNAGATIYVQSYVPNDAVVANLTLKDSTGTDDSVRIEAAYMGELEYGESGNRTGVTVTNGYRVQTEVAQAALSGEKDLYVDSVIGFEKNDCIKIETTPVQYNIVDAIDEINGKLTLKSALSADVQVDKVVGVMGIRIRTYRKNINGVVQEAETDKGAVYCSLNPASKYYAGTVHKDNKFIKVTGLIGTIGYTQYPVDKTLTYLSGGSYGTAPGNSDWITALSAFDNLPVRFLACAETTAVETNKGGETYCKSRQDTPLWIYNITSNQVKATLISIGRLYQRSDDVHGVICEGWIEYNGRYIPNVGAVIGAWMQAINDYGIHYTPAIRKISLRGFNSVYGQEFNDEERTQIAEAGINLIRYVPGSGIIIRNFFTPSTAIEYMFANGLLMRNYIKVSAVDSLQASENMPNTLVNIREDRTAVYNFMRRLWEVGSTLSVPTGETFGMYEKDGGETSKFDDHVEIIADAVNNPVESLQAGERNIYVYFTYPAPAGSIKIGVGIKLL